MKIQDIKKIYFIGIKGAGMTAVAQILQNRNIEIYGSDTKEVFYTDAILKRLGIPFFEEFAVENIPADSEVVVYSTAYNEQNNVEIAEAKKRNIPMYSYPETLGMLFEEKLGIAVCGTHGKTTTSAMLAEAFVSAGTDPSAIIGSQVISWQGSALAGKGEYFIAEADEYQNKLKYYNPWSAILTSVDFDHPDFFANIKAYKQVFKDFVVKIPKTGFLVAWGDSIDTIEVSQEANCKVLTYGFNNDNDYRIINHESEISKDGLQMQVFEIESEGKILGIFQTPLVGKHNVLNACSVVALAHVMNLDLEKITALAGSPVDATYTVSHINGSIYSGTGRPVGDVAGNGNASTFPLKLAGGGILKKQA